MHYAKEPFKSLVLLALFFLLAGFFPAPGLAGTGGITIFVDGQELNLEEPAIIQDGYVLAPVRALAEALQARVTWNEGTNEVIITGPQTTIKMVAGSKDVYKNEERLSLSVPVQVRNGRVLAPARFLAESLGAGVSWNALTLTVAITTPPPAVPERVYAAPFPARVAFSANNHLWLLDGSQAGAGPVQVTKDGAVQILGWSPDGQWLAYLQWETSEFRAGKPYLWVVRADGNGAFQVDQRPVLAKASWSPVDSILAYSTQGPGGGYAPDMNLRLAAIESGQARLTTLIPDKGELVEDFAWAPDGQSLAVSLPRTQDEPLRIDRLTLKGERSNLLTLGEAGTPIGEVYPSFAYGFSWSPGGRYLAYHLHPNSASLAADAVDLQVLDLGQPGKPLDLGVTLNYSGWLAWSPDGSRLAYIRGGGRDATIGKRLTIVDLEAGGKSTDYGQAGQVDTMPVWLPAADSGVLYCRGPENKYWEGNQQNDAQVLVPGQRIWWQKLDGKAVPVTSGPAGTADYYPSVSPDGQNLIYLRLDRRDSGSLYRQPLAGGPAVELVRNLNGSPGYYGNYYPAWISIYYLDQTTRVSGKIVVSDVEGRHYELETARGRLVLVPDKGYPVAAQDLEKYAGREVIVAGVISGEPSMYMRGPLLRVRSVTPAGGIPAPAARLTSFTIARPNLVVKGQHLARVEIWAIPTGTGITEKDYTLLGQAGKQAETSGEQVWIFPIPKETILATALFARGYDEQGRDAGRISLPVEGVTALNKALGTVSN
ncbi:stalk domain-containing protein [Neomoorella thermoacetica]|uniref:stalk domain-containing protein n=1 Tax=Neomoorella thermoacetica TaxID=1525 RepID=UPI0030CE2BBF